MDSTIGYFYRFSSEKLKAVIFEAPSMISAHKDSKDDIFNMVMIDVSGSMNYWWLKLRTGWNETISQNLSGTSKIFVFGSKVQFCRNDTFLCDSDFHNSSTNLSKAISTISEEICETSCKNIRVFLVTDGEHNATSIKPDTEIEKLFPPDGKTVEVFLLGIGTRFPVEYSINIRSKLHNGNSNMPSLFWAQDLEELPSQLGSIGEILRSGCVKFQTSLPGCLAPGFDDVTEMHLGEFLYFDKNLEDALQLKLFLEDLGEIDFTKEEKELSVRLFLKIMRQWNSLLIQQHRKHKNVKMSIFDTIDHIYSNLMTHLKGKLEGSKESILTRIEKKNVKTLEVEYKTLLNQSKTLIGLEGKFMSELELAEGILKTTVQSKYDLKNLKIKGYGDEDYTKDVKNFLSVYESIVNSIKALPEPPPGECCSITLSSTLRDLQDENLPLLFEEDKFTLMKTLNITGIPILAPVKDSSQINPWTLRIKNILVYPYSIISHTTLELSAETAPIDDENMGIYLQEGNESSHFNAVVPVFTQDVVKVLKPLLRTNIFGMLCTFAILKNPHIIDMNAHLAALSIVWIKTLKAFSKEERPEYIVTRLSLLEATGRIYLDRKGVAKYIEVLFEEPKEALMTESKKQFPDITLKCEALNKPCFLLYLKRDLISDYMTKKTIVKLIVAEFVGRCLSNYQAESTGHGTYCSFFAKNLHKIEERTKWLQDQAQKIVDDYPLSKEEIHKKCYSLEDVQKEVLNYCLMSVQKVTSSQVEVDLDRKKFAKLYNPSSAGDITLNHLKSFAEEMEITQSDIQEIFSDEQKLVYIVHALQYRNSRDRLSSDILEYEEAFKFVEKRLSSEVKADLTKMMKEKTREYLESLWLEEHKNVHQTFVKPLSRDAIISKANTRGIVVSEESFDKIYKYNKKSGLMRNACLIEACPHFLKPNRSFNQHLAILRKEEYPHELHRVALNVAKKGGTAKRVIDDLVSGRYGGQNKRRKPNPPSLAYIASFTEQIEQLIEDYKKLN